ncbi:AlpA family phage regulatory protein [Paraburkholderia sp. EB58]|uniref:AlpA family phage regulatory protein n=1 Tax=Paraburkholderia sp. EB58 TaxID=3035125 RepID=UPI003D21C8D3
MGHYPATRSGTYKCVKEGTFPPPLKIPTEAVGWRVCQHRNLSSIACRLSSGAATIKEAQTQANSNRSALNRFTNENCLSMINSRTFKQKGHDMYRLLHVQV